jgi:hypothetical protein
VDLNFQAAENVLVIVLEKNNGFDGKIALHLSAL